MKPIEKNQELIDILNSEVVQVNEKVIEYERIYISPVGIEIKKDKTDTTLKITLIYENVDNIVVYERKEIFVDDRKIF